MKNRILLLLLFLASGLFATEKDSLQYNFREVQFSKMPFIVDDCDGCGGASGGSLGFSSILNNNFAGIRYFSQSYSSRDGIFKNSPWIDEDFNTIQAWARIPVTSRIQISALVPYHFLSRKKASGDENVSGVGDITLLAMYSVVRSASDSTSAYSHILQLGGGVKAPTGKYKSENNEGSVNPAFQLGTGSWDYLLAAEYVIRRENLGLNTMLNYTFKTENEKNYRFGDQFNYGGTLFYLLDFESVKLVPQAGIAGESYKTNRQFGQDSPDTAGNIVFSKFGLEAGRDKLSVGINAMLPLSQNLTGGRVEANHRWSVNVNYTL